MSDIVPAHSQKFTHSYVVRYPSHDPRSRDPHKHDFLEWKRRRHADGKWWCDFAMEHRAGDFSECWRWDASMPGTVEPKPLEAHHRVVELAMLNEIDLELLEKDFPGISADSVGEWIDSDPNLVLYCVSHHRGPGGVHTASFSDFTSEGYVRNLIGPVK